MIRGGRSPVTDHSTPTDLMDLKVGQFVDTLASDIPAPGGGSAAALTGALSAALIEMVANLTIGRDEYAGSQVEMKAVLNATEPIRRELTDLVDRDTRAFKAVMAAMRLPRATEEEKNTRRVSMQEAVKEATQVPLRVTELACELLALARVVAEKGNPNAVTDAGVAGRLALAAAEGAGLNVEINLPSIRDEVYRKEAGRRVAQYVNLAREAAAETAGVVAKRMS